MHGFRKILVAVDTSQGDQPALRRAMRLADQNQATLHIVDVLRDISLAIRLLSSDYAHVHELLIREKQEGLEKLVALCQSHGVSATCELLEGTASSVLLDAVTRGQFDLLIKEAKGVRSIEKVPIGATAQRLLAKASCSIWLTHAPYEQKYQKIVAAINAIPNDQAHAQLNRQILAHAIDLAKFERCGLLIAYAWDLYGANLLKNRLPEREFDHLVEQTRKLHQESFESVLAEFDLHATGPQARLIQGEPSQAITKLCERENANLLVCGTVARWGLAGFMLGNTVDRILRQVECSVLAIKPNNSHSASLQPTQ